ncbi:hypothetical protein A3765_09590 [Oleiphilus sp. HI0130]|nr:hypothetical protein A3765_09590 [Oleiphilus sp. HI0130]
MSLTKKRIITADYSDGVDRKLLRQIRDRFLLVNQRRLDRTYESLPSKQADILRLIPLLYQVNHPLLPGYVSRDAPRGVSGYAPDKVVLSIAAGFSRTFRYKQDRRHKAQIQALFIMGSSGTLAHSEASDVDAWLCVDPSLNADQEQILAAKARKIDDWANKEGLELHTFVMCAERFKQGQAAPAMDKESSGSAQHFLLLDEFYRTAILLTGRYPLWWLVPPDAEGSYAEITQLLLGNRFVKEADVLDFGSTHTIPKSELIGAGLWQLYKSLESPYKSALKLLLAEVYARELPEYPCLSVEFKQAVYEDELEPSELDPYFMLYRRLESYLRRQQEEKRLELVRKSFYLKVNKKLSRAVKPRVASWQRMFMEQQVAQWGWGKGELAHLDERYDWKVTQVLEERQALLSELTNAYRFLTSYARANAIESSITQQDMSLLGRKLYAVFQRKAGKIEIVNLGITPNIWEENLAIHHGSSQEFSSDSNAWLLYKNLASSADAAYSQPLRKSSSLVELLAWLYFNGIATRSTRLSVVPGARAVTIRDVHSALDTLEQVYPLPLPYVPQSAYETSAKVSHILLLVNLGAQAGEDEDELMRRISDRTDSLSYSSERLNLVSTIDQVVLNSWGEISAVRYEVGETLMQNLQAYLQLCLEQGDKALQLIVRCFSAFRSSAIETRVKTLFYEARALFFVEGKAQDLRYVLEIGEAFYVIQRVEEQFRFERHANRQMLMERLQRTELSYQPIKLDSYALESSLMLRAVLAQDEAEVVQVFYQFTAEAIHLCVLDERGSVLEYLLPRQEEVVFQSSIFNFLSTVVERRQLSVSAQAFVSMPSIILYSMTPSDGDFRIKRIKRIDLVQTEAVHAMGVIDGDVMHFDLSLQGRDFSVAEYGEQQLSALDHFYRKMRSKESVPLKLVDVSFPADPLGMLRNEAQGFGTLDYLKVFLDFEVGIKGLQIT